MFHRNLYKYMYMHEIIKGRCQARSRALSPSPLPGSPATAGPEAPRREGSGGCGWGAGRAGAGGGEQPADRPGQWGGGGGKLHPRGGHLPRDPAPWALRVLPTLTEPPSTFSYLLLAVCSPASLFLLTSLILSLSVSLCVSLSSS